MYITEKPTPVAEKDGKSWLKNHRFLRQHFLHGRNIGEKETVPN